ncbi:MAG: hypothetical protein ACI4JM_05200 [Oscillospiraceae bacterium]
MTDKNVQGIDISEQDLISRVMLDLINSCPYIPGGFTVQYGQLAESECMALIAVPGAVKLKEYITGSYLAQFPTALYYRSYPKDTLQRLNAQKIIDNTGQWLENAEYPAIDGNRTIQKIYRASSSEIAYRGDNGIEDWQILITLEYKFQK